MNRHGDTLEQKKLIKKLRKDAYNYMKKDQVELQIVAGNKMFINRAIASDKWILLVHGLGSSAYKMMYYAKAFNLRGYNTIVLDLGKSAFHLAETVELSIKACIAEFATVKQLGIFAQSLGAAAVVNSIQSLPRNPDFLILESPVNSILDGLCRVVDQHKWLKLFAKRLTKWCEHRKGDIPFIAEDNAKFIKCPSLWFAGTEDWLCPVWTVLRMFNSLSSEVKKFEMFYSSHCRAMWRQPEKFWKSIDEFLINT